MRPTSKIVPAVLTSLALFGVVGCEDSATPPTPEQQAANVESQKAAMEKFRATNKSGKMKADASAKPAEAPPADAPKE